jgi:cell wall-associated NlpC family hydrolase
LSGSSARSRRRGAISLTVLAVTTLLTAPARAEPSPSARDMARSRKQVRDRAAEVGRINAALAQAAGRLEDLAGQAELAVERFNGARVKLEQAEQDYKSASQRSARARGRLEETRHDLAVFAAGAYRSDNTYPSATAVLGGRGGPTGFMDRAAIMQELANRQHALVQQDKAAKTVAGLFERQAHQAMTAQRDAARAAAAARQAATAAVARQRMDVERIEQQKAGLVAALGKARAHVAELQRMRDAAPAGGQDPSAGRDLSRGLVRGSGLGAVAARAALKWLGTPYSWGGGTPGGPSLGTEQGAHTVGFDCSGLVTYAWARAGVRLVHYATTQYNSGPHPARSQLRPGDLVFFAHQPSNPGTIHHVGIYVGHDQMVEAPFTGARVRISYAFRPDYAGATRPAG